MTRNVWSFSTETNKDLTNIFKKKKGKENSFVYSHFFFSTVFPQFLGAHLWVYNVLWSGILSLSSIFIPSLCSLLLFESPRCGRSRWLWKWCWQRERESRTNEREFFFSLSAVVYRLTPPLFDYFIHYSIWHCSV